MCVKLCTHICTYILCNGFSSIIFKVGGLVSWPHCIVADLEEGLRAVPPWPATLGDTEEWMHVGIKILKIQVNSCYFCMQQYKTIVLPSKGVTPVLGQSSDIFLANFGIWPVKLNLAWLFGKVSIFTMSRQISTM